MTIQQFTAAAVSCAALLGCHSTPSDGASAPIYDTHSAALAEEIRENPPCETSNDCPENRYCRYPDNNCGREGLGRCLKIPEWCEHDEDPFNDVCGCDGKPYINACVANQARTDEDPYGTCGKP